jgi:CO/xanthine dehydrogenase Mo-binding subunit
MLLSAKALLDRNPEPSRREVAHALRGNLCRCTGYVKIIDAVLAAAAMLRGECDSAYHPPREVVGGDLRRFEALAKVTGKERYAGDLAPTGALHAKVLRSPHAHALIESIDPSAALAMEGVEAVITAEDIPGVKQFDDLWGARDVVWAAQHTNVALEPILAIDRVRMVGEPVAMVVAQRESVAEAALRAVKVRYLPLKANFDPASALTPEAESLHAGGNLYEIERIQRGDLTRAQDEAEVILETDYESPSQEHATLEPESMLAYPTEEGRLVVIGPTHQPHARQGQIAQMLGLPPGQVRVVVPKMGGSFGSRQHFWPIVAAALPAYLLKQPVRTVYSRSESFQASVKRHPFRFHYRIGARRDGRLVSLQARALGNAGPYGGAPSIGPFVATCGTGPYRWEAIEYDSRVAHTNWANGGAFRGYGMPQAVLALEGALDELAHRLGIDPWDLRHLNAVDDETGTATGQRFDEPFGFKQVLEAVRPRWRELRGETDQLQRDPDPGYAYGAGLAASWYQFGKAGDLRVEAQAGIDLQGQITLYYSALRCGVGLDTVISQLASHELGVPRQHLRLVNSDTDRTLDSHTYGACRSTYWVGGAVQQAARTLKRALLTTAAEMLDLPPDRLALADRAVISQGDARLRLPLREVAQEMDRVGLSLVYTGALDLEDRFPKSERPQYLGHFVAGITLAQVRVTKRTGVVEVLRAILAQDVGKALNPQDLEGQLQGAIVMDLGAALMEEYIPGETLDFKSYPLPRTTDVPQIEVIPVEVPGHDGPLGAKGVGEATMGHTRAAILNATCDAIGARLRRIPATPERVLQAAGWSHR